MSLNTLVAGMSRDKSGDDAAEEPPRSGSFTLVLGEATVLNPSVTEKTIVLVSRKVAAGTLGQGFTYSLSPGVSFTVISVGAVGGTVATDESEISFFLVESP